MTWNIFWAVVGGGGCGCGYAMSWLLWAIVVVVVVVMVVVYCIENIILLCCLYYFYVLNAKIKPLMLGDYKVWC